MLFVDGFTEQTYSIMTSNQIQPILEEFGAFRPGEVDERFRGSKFLFQRIALFPTNARKFCLS